jgi:hypothetical protein
MDINAYARKAGPAVFLEITDRDELGHDLHAPQASEGGGNRYRLITDDPTRRHCLALPPT